MDKTVEDCGKVTNFPKKKPANNKKPPKEEENPKVTANQVFDMYDKHCKESNIIRIYWRGSYYQYNGCKYEEIEDSLVRICITRYMTIDNTDLAPLFSRSLMLDVEHIYKSHYIAGNETEVNTFMTGPKGDMYISLKNGILDINAYLEGKVCLLPHTPDFFTLCTNPFDFNPGSTCPTFIKFLNSSQPDKQGQRFLQEWTGYNLTFDTRLETLVLLQGGGLNGKSVYGLILKIIVGFSNFSAVAPEDLGQDSKKLSLLGKKANICDDMNDNKQINFGTLKQTVSGTHVTVDRKYKESLTFAPTAKHTFIGNQFMNISDRSDGTIRRIIPVHFGEKIAEKDKDLRLGRPDFWIDSGEIEGIFIWALEGLRRLKDNNWEWTVVDASEKIKNEIKEESQPEIGFFKQCLEITGDANDKVGTKQLHDLYTNWMGKSKAQLKLQTLVKAILSFNEKILLSKNNSTSKTWEGRQRFLSGVKIIVNRSPQTNKLNSNKSINEDYSLALNIKEDLKSEIVETSEYYKQKICSLEFQVQTLDAALSEIRDKLKSAGINLSI